MPVSKKTKNTDTLILSTFIKLLRAAESVTVRSHRHLSEIKLSFGQFSVMEALYHLGPLCQKEIAGKILKSPRNITMIVDNLEKRHLARRERNTDDRRYLNIHLTEAGRILFEQIFPRHIEGLKREMEILNEAELEELGDLCRILGTKRR